MYFDTCHSRRCENYHIYLQGNVLKVWCKRSIILTADGTAAKARVLVRVARGGEDRDGDSDQR